MKGLIRLGESKTKAARKAPIDQFQVYSNDLRQPDHRGQESILYRLDENSSDDEQ